MRTDEPDYARRLARLESASWKRLLDVQRPYRLHLRRLALGRVLDVGCGLGRNLANLGGRGAVGVDHNADSVAIARARGFEAYTVEAFAASAHAAPDTFDALLLSHVVEHLAAVQAAELLRAYLGCLRAGGRVVVITPQEAGHRSDPTHERFVGFDEARALLEPLGLTTESQYSFPFARPLGRVFRYNEFVTIARKPDGAIGAPSE